MKEGLELARIATAEQLDTVKRKVMSEVSHDPSIPPASICTSIANTASGACLPITNGSAEIEGSGENSTSAFEPTAGKHRQYSGKRVPDPDSTTNARKGGTDRNLNEAVVGGDEFEGDMESIGVEERSTQPFTGIKEPSKNAVSDLVQK